MSHHSYRKEKGHESTLRPATFHEPTAKLASGRMLLAAASDRAAMEPAQLSLALQDLSADPLLATTHRVMWRGREVPSLGGVPLLAKIGHGGMGAVYYGIHPRLKQEVAVKVLPILSAEMNPDLVHRFFREAQMAVRVDSPNIVRVLDVNEEQNIFFLVMEYVAGPSAGAYLRELRSRGDGGLPENHALDIALAATRGLAAAHEKSVVHRDIKPDNIMIPCRDSTMLFDSARLADLGLGRCEALGRSLTGANASLGTPGFMPPEQATDAKAVSKTADVFGVGATLYALVSGKAPFSGSSPIETIFNTVQAPHKPIREVCPQISKPTAEMIEICLEKAPEQRFSDGGTLLDAVNICRDAIGQPERTQAQAVEHLQALKRASADSSASRIASIIVKRNSRRRLRDCVLAKAGIVAVAAGCAFGFVQWRDREFFKARENVLHHAAYNCSPSPDEVGCGVGILEAFVREHSSRSPEDLAPVTEQLAQLRRRRTKLADRKRQFEQLLAESEQQTPRNPEAARAALDQAQKLGAGNDEADLPDLITATMPAFDERRRQIEAEQRAAAERISKQNDAAAREAFMQSFTAAQEAAHIPDWDAVQISLEAGFAKLGDRDHPVRAAAAALLQQAKSEVERHGLQSDASQFLPPPQR